MIDLDDDARYRSRGRGPLSVARRKGVLRERLPAGNAQPQLADRRRCCFGAAMRTACCAARSALIPSTWNTCREVIGLRPAGATFAAMNMLMLPQHTVFICDTYINADPTAEEIAEMTMLAAEEMCRFGLEPRVALLSHSSFGSSDARIGARRCARARPDPRRADRISKSKARCVAIRRCPSASWTAAFPDARLRTEANLLIMPNLDAANIAYNVLKIVAGEGVTVGPDPARRRQARPHPYADKYRARHRQHDGARCRGCIDKELT